ncbi:MAG: 2-oxoacid:acceptor oxidoreductase family protein [Holosporaceae bacterium]|jgi:pyruvate ferredoxin oxidoreductase gamma subunit|nr:2-oxoacid:acceptor oxidoreductase family protein [Holosporaceae bacterium]
MFQIRIHGRGGQGVVTAAELLSIAAFLDGKHSQAFPSFGSERMGAPVTAFCRISEKEIYLREPIMEPNAVIIQDRTVIEPSNAFHGIVDSGFALVSSRAPVSCNNKSIRVSCIDAVGVAMEYIGKPIPNAVLLGSFAALTGIIKIDSVIAAIKQKFSGTIAEKNIKAACFAYDKTQKGDL